MHRLLLLSVLIAVVPSRPADAQVQQTFTHADSLRGNYNSPARAWWDVTFYNLHIAFHPADSTVSGYNGIGYRVLKPGTEMQIDLQAPLVLDSMVQSGRHVTYRQDGDAYFARPVAPDSVGAVNTLTVYYHGKPHVARRPPWDGGVTWTTDSLGHPWFVTTDEGIGASVYWPLKDTWADEPDSQRIAITVPDPMIEVSNGRLRSTTHNPDGTTTYEWFVTNPINTYDVAVSAGDYAHYSDTYQGEGGTLTLDFWPLAYHLAAAHRQFPQAKSMLKCFEHWFGPYPWYADGYKLVEAPHPGMEHQSAVAYGNWYANGYRLRDVSGTGLGLKWDFIIVHESAHEWFGNNITAKDRADMWIHESFANYAESLYTECLFGKQAGAEYNIGSRHNIRNDRPIIAPYGVNAEGSGDMYYKGGAMRHTIRQIVGNDEKWRGILRGLNTTFRHQTVTAEQIEDYISQHAGIDLSKVFQQYLTTTKVPVFEYRIAGNTLSYHWADVVPGFAMPVAVKLSEEGYTVVHPTEQWQTAKLTLTRPGDFAVDPNYYVVARQVTAGTEHGGS